MHSPNHVRFQVVRCLVLADSVEKLKNETAKSRVTPVDADFRQCNAIWGACGGRSLRIALVMWSPHINLGWAHQRLCKISVTHEIGLFQHYWHLADKPTAPQFVGYWRAGSTDRRNTGVKSLCWGLKLQGLTWSFVELTRYLVQMSLRVHR